MDDCILELTEYQSEIQQRQKPSFGQAQYVFLLHALELRQGNHNGSLETQNGWSQLVAQWALGRSMRDSWAHCSCYGPGICQPSLPKDGRDPRLVIMTPAARNPAIALSRMSVNPKNAEQVGREVMVSRMDYQSGLRSIIDTSSGL